jgi:uncharacterized protein (TIGR02186 family)
MKVLSAALSRAAPLATLLPTVLAAFVMLLASVMPSDAQRRVGPQNPRPKAVVPAPVVAAPQAAPAPVDTRPRERIEADVSTRSIAVTSAYTGTRIVVFGTVVDSRQQSAASGYYDLVIVLEGTPGEVVVRKKSRTFGIWRNTDSITISDVPSFYAIVATRPPDEIAEAAVLSGARIGFEHVNMSLPAGLEKVHQEKEIAAFKASVIRLKGDKDLYLESPYGVSFIGPSLFRASIDLPANVPVGPLTARIHLFREGRLLDTFRSKVVLQREGVGLALHTFALQQSLLYGLLTVLTAVGAGLAATALFPRGGH